MKVSLPDNFTIPTVPAAIAKITALFDDSDVGARDIADAVGEDAPLAAKVMKIANSAFYGLRERCMSMPQAVTVLGLRVVRNVVTQASVIQQFEHLEELGFDTRAMWKHSIATAQACQYIARHCRRKLTHAPEELYTCGLLHDVGEIVMLDNHRATYVEVVQNARAANIPLHVAERDALGFDHADVGHEIARAWSLPPGLTAAIQCHHGQESLVLRDALVTLVAKTNLLCERVMENDMDGASNAFAGQAAVLLGITQADVTALARFVAEALPAIEL